MTEKLPEKANEPLGDRLAAQVRKYMSSEFGSLSLVYAGIGEGPLPFLDTINVIRARTTEIFIEQRQVPIRGKGYRPAYLAEGPYTSLLWLDMGTQVVRQLKVLHDPAPTRQQTVTQAIRDDLTQLDIAFWVSGGCARFTVPVRMQPQPTDLEHLAALLEEGELLSERRDKAFLYLRENFGAQPFRLNVGLEPPGV